MSYPVRRWDWARPLQDWDPFRDIATARGELARVLGALAGASGRSEWSPDVDVAEDEQGWTVIARLPGVSPEEVSVEIDGRDLCIRTMTATETAAEEQAGAAEQAGAEQSRAEQSGVGQSGVGQPGVAPAGAGEQATVGEERTVPHPAASTARFSSHASFGCRLTLPADADTERIDATMDHGLLSVRIPHSGRSRRRAISVGRGDRQERPNAQGSQPSGSE